MSIKQLNPRVGVLLLFILVAGILRVALAKASAGHLTPMSNFSPIGAMGLFGGAYFTKKWKSYLFPLVTLLLSDLLINSFYYPNFSSMITGMVYDGWYYTYIAFAAMVLMGQLLIKKVTASNVLIAAVAAAFVHWIVSDIGPWKFGFDPSTNAPYAQSVAGFVRCLVMAIPFELNLLYGNLIYGVAFFGTFELMQRRFPALAKQTI